ncbi:two-component system, OmpR family, copper resistance phosphate regulon response regulator CusR/two-component system, OmpR family, response regulator TctD [Variovorax sp. YR634]|uniref:response regulator transcription factor n=1 Tax=Variovorax sp. YR634 TaxID=1884385 RepID=UPI000898C777|nr:response regulator transcription factor [Variovorax sp. YR634]SDZ26159.1 two-component system, OmpR family, copper resistance phosphate regulon response regulator CusR/two-component system, OmpR family, response regulator TctD [Variovorax sp. YR634]
MKLLLVEDSPKLRAALVRGLTHLGFVVEEAHDGPTGLWAAENTHPDVVVLDVMLPGFDGIELLRRMRARNIATPVLMLTALAEVEDRLKGFEAGTDDYLPKPFDLRELAARAQALVRRVSAWAHPVIVLGDLEIDSARCEVRRDGATLPMRRRERALLELLALSGGKAVSRQTIEAKLYAGDSDLRSNSIEAAVSQLRRWIDVPGQRSRIVTLRGEGYRLER